MSRPITKQEVLLELSAKLRNDALSDNDFIRLLVVYAKLNGWFT